MLIFHEGLPRSGKSFEAVAKHLIPALKKGRHCYVRIDELNYEQLARLAGIDIDQCNQILHHLDESQILTIDQIEIPIGSLVIIDELQNYFPDTGRRPLSPGVTKFVAEHGHKGLDIVFMGQDLKDCHKIWRRRVDTKILFSKLDMLGSKKYNWSLSKAIAPEKFKHVSSGTADYDPSIFGSYKSFESGAEVAQTYDDKRRSIWSNKAFRRWIPLFGVILIVAIIYLFNLFKGGGLANSINGNKAAAPVASAVAPPPTASVSQAPAAPLTTPKGQKDYVQDLCERYRLRLSAVIRTKSRMSAQFEWFDDGLHAVERMSMSQLIANGYAVIVSPDMDSAFVIKGMNKYVATQFPLEGWARVSDQRQKEIAGPDSSKKGAS